LQGVDREVPQVAQRGVPGTEVVDGQADANVLEGAQDLDGEVDVIHEHRLGDLEAQLRGIDAGRSQGAHDVADEVGRRQLTGREVHAEDTARHADLRPPVQLSARLM